MTDAGNPPTAPLVRARQIAPARLLAARFGAAVDYDKRTGTVIVRRGTVRVVVPRRDVHFFRGAAWIPVRPLTAAFARTVAHVGTVAPASPSASPSAVPVASALAAIVAPADGARIDSAYPTLSARFPGRTVATAGLTLSLDGRAVADAAAIGDTVTATVRAPLAAGPHAVALEARASDGTPLHAAWSFVDTFAFAPQASPTPPVFRVAYIDRVVTPGTSTFDVVVRGAPGMFGAVAVDGVNARFPLTVAGYGLYVAHVVVPPGVVQPFAQVAIRLQLPDGTLRTVVLPQTVPLVTRTSAPATRKPLER